MALSGLFDTIVYTLTRRQLLVVTDVSASDGLYNAYSGSHTYQTHISTVGGGGGGKQKRPGARSKLRRGLQTLNDTVNDHRNDSAEGIVQPDEWEMKNMEGGVYQETTIEITHETADQEEDFHNRKQGEYRG